MVKNQKIRPNENLILIIYSCMLIRIVNIGNNLGKIGTVEVAGSVPMVPAIKIQRVTVIAVTFIIIDGFVKSPTSALCCIS